MWIDVDTMLARGKSRPMLRNASSIGDDATDPGGVRIQDSPTSSDSPIFLRRSHLLRCPTTTREKELRLGDRHPLQAQSFAPGSDRRDARAARRCNAGAPLSANSA